MPNFQPYLQSPLVNFNLPAEAVPADNSQQARANELPLLGYIVLRSELADPAIAAAIKQVSGVAVPAAGQFTNGEGGVLIWQSPDEALLVTQRGYVPKLLKAFDEAFSGLFAQAVDNSGGLTCVYLSGAEHVTVLRHMGVYDFESIETGDAVSTVLGRAGALIARADKDGVFLVIRRSFADYLWLLLRKAAVPYRFAVVKLPTSGKHPFLRLAGAGATPKLAVMA
ncbi:sarcosine oxidase subunit gamma family protein [Crenobacter sp. SG2305]|uniref:sarcosine oxidase subunit gamma n=1 Tax=Crenobacter oryzisoli TaxID=3056844 RepID=UPI0025AA71D2|nr:sarcosine oxidase subunit gamma family protein [Crenobacter sp. SG2305]MDN0085330.1 sarcosine oxidase subunit gamma family protein [Crenobacter sp. SG2305]